MTIVDIKTETEYHFCSTIVGKKDAVIVDVDGTLAVFNPDREGRWVNGTEKSWDLFFEVMREAPVIEPVIKLVRTLKQQKNAILICSGRPKAYEQETKDWLMKNEIPFDGIYLRPHNCDEVPDEIVKRELLNSIYIDGFAPWLVLDDRDSVVKQWRDLGLTCLQCAPGNF